MDHRRIERAAVGRGRDGFTMVDLMVAATLLILGLGSLSGTIVAALEVARANEERSIAADAARSVAERLQGEPFQDVFRAFNGDPTDDPGGVGSGAGPHFAVPGLAARADDPDGLPGRISFPVLAGTPPAEMLREDVEDERLGMPRDLNGDGDVDGENHRDDYVLLPVTITVEWTGASGDRSIALHVLLVRT